MKIVMEHKLGSILVMPEHLKKCHPFVARSFLKPFRDEDIEDFESESPPTAEVVHEPSAPRDTPSSEAVSPVPNAHNKQGIDSSVDGGTTTTVDGQGTVGADQHLASDRRHNFIIDDSPELGPESFFARKRVSKCARLGIPKVSAIAVREYGTEKYGKLLRFLYTVPDHVQDRLNTWLAVPKAGMDTTRTLFRSEGSESNVL